jgi:hypothetical protein
MDEDTSAGRREAATSATHPPKPSLFLRVAVTGHRPRPGRTLNADKVRDACAVLFDDLAVAVAGLDAGLFEPAPPVLALVSSLAEGADQIAVEAFSAGGSADPVRRRLEAVLPFAVEDYAGTFDDAAAVAAMRRWLEAADSRLVLSDWRPPPRTPEPDALPAYWRDRRYATAGSVLLDQADILLAIWDGQPSRGRGGAGDVVVEAVQRGLPVIWIEPVAGVARLLSTLDPDQDLFQDVERQAATVDLGQIKPLVARLLSPPEPAHAAGGHDHDRRGDPAEDIGKYLTEERIPTATVWTVYHNLLVRPAMRFLFRKSRRGGAAPGWRLRLDCDYVARDLADDAWPGFPRSLPASSFERMRRWFNGPWAAADSIGTRLGHVYRSVYLLIFGSGAVAVAAGLLALVFDQVEGFNSHAVFALLELAVLLFATALYWFGGARAHHRRLIAARELSEQMRAHWGAALLGLVGRRPLAEGAPWTAWLFNAYVAPIGPPDLEASPPALHAIAIAVRDGILAAQKAYHRNNADRLARIHHWLEQRGLAILLLALGSAVLLTAITWSEAPLHLEHRLGEPVLHALVSVLTFANGVLPALGAALAGIRYQGDFERFSDRSQETFDALARIETSLERFIAAADHDGPLAPSQAPLFEQLRAIVLELREVLLADVEDWRFVYVARPSPEPG